MHAEPPKRSGSFLRSRAGIALLIFLSIGAFFLWTEHRAHVFGYLPYGLLALGVVAHLFMHGGHGGHGTHGKDTAQSDKGGLK